VLSQAETSFVADRAPEGIHCFRRAVHDLVAEI